jgi:hypothetical protein
MGRASRVKQGVSRQQKIAAQRAAARRARIRSRMLLAAGAVAVVVAVVVAFVLVKVSTGPRAAAPGGASNGPTGAALARVVSEVTNVPAATLSAVGTGSGVTATPQPVTGPPLTAGGKPEVLYIGAEYCPFCAAERWAAIVALSRFGTFSGLRTVHSSSTDVYANTPTFTFDKSRYTSRYLTFTAVETYTNLPSGSFYAPLQKPTAAEQALMNTYDAPPYVPAQDLGSIPFYDFGNRYMISGASFTPQLLDGESWSQIAAALSNPASPIARAVDGTANYLTAAICTLTRNQPASACTPAVTALEKKL